ncbi:DNA modification methylase [Kitasatospora herbaricolor]|nr:DNA modification methylase [Kitasatospora herbaricolor]
MSSFTLHRGDALTVLKSLPDESVNAVITDPPYNSGGRTNCERTSRDARAKYVTSNSAHDLRPSRARTEISARTAPGSPNFSRRRTG